MFKKKRLFLYLCGVAVVWLAWQFGMLVALVCVAGAALLLLLLKLFRMASAGRGTTVLQAKTHHRFEAMIAALPERGVSEAPWSFVVLGDTRNNTVVARALYSRARTLAPDMVFHTGDIVRGGSARELLRNHVALVEECLAPTPMFCVAGNHERGPHRDYAAFSALYGGERFSFSHGDCLFTGFNNCRNKGISDEDLAWLADRLSPPHRSKFVFMHIPPAYFEAAFVNDAHRRGFKKNAEAFHRLLVDRQVDEVFMAHIHGFATCVMDGVRYTLSAGGGAQLSHRIAPEDRCHHLLHFMVTPGGVTRTLLKYDSGVWESRSIPG